MFFQGWNSNATGMYWGEDYIFSIYISLALNKSAYCLLKFIPILGFWEGEDGGDMGNFSQEAIFLHINFGCGR